MSTDEPGMRDLDERECWKFLRDHEFGRLAFRLVDEVHIAPINYAVDDRTLLFRTAEGSKLLGMVMHPSVAFEVDEVDEHRATSVILRGSARILDAHEEHRAENVPLRPWAEGERHIVVEIAPFEVSGRDFHLHRPWLHLVPTDD